VKAVYYQASLYLVGLSFILYQSTWVLLFVYVLYKIAFIYLGYTVLIGRIIIGIINWKDCERKL